MSILTESERNAIEDECEMMIGKPAFDAIEAAVIRKLATVSVEPFRRFQFRDGATFPEMHPKMDLETINLFTIEALAAARVQAIEEAASRVKEFNHPLVNLTIDGRARLATEIRALIT